MLSINKKFTIIYPCNYCKQFTKHLIEAVPEESKPRDFKNDYMITCPNCGFYRSITKEDYEKQRDTQEEINYVSAIKILDKAKELHESKEYKDWIKGIDETIKNGLFKASVQEKTVSDTEAVDSSLSIAEEMDKHFHKIDLTFKLYKYFFLLYCFNFILLRLGHPEMSLLEQLVQPVLNILFVGLILLIPTVIYYQIRIKNSSQRI